MHKLNKALNELGTDEKKPELDSKNREVIR